MSGALAPDTAIALMQAGQNETLNATRSIKDAQKNKQYEKIDEVAREFEAVFLSEMLKPMFTDSTMVDAPLSGGKGEEIFRGMMVQEYGKILAQTGGIGLADHVREQMISMQEAADALNAIEPGGDETSIQDAEILDDETLGGASHD